LKENTSKISLTLSKAIKSENIFIRFLKPYPFKIIVNLFHQVARQEVCHQMFALGQTQSFVCDNLDTLFSPSHCLDFQRVMKLGSTHISLKKHSCYVFASRHPQKQCELRACTQHKRHSRALRRCPRRKNPVGVGSPCCKASRSTVLQCNQKRVPKPAKMSRCQWPAPEVLQWTGGGKS
jgi:hypothetical protein